MERRKCERKLEGCIDSMVDEMNAIYCADLTQEAKIDSKMSDIRMRDELISQIKEAIRCKKISERLMAEESREVSYLMQVRIGREGVEYSIAHDDASSRHFE